MMKRILSFIQKEFFHIFRDKRTVLILIGMPIVQMLLFGFAISTEVNNITFAVAAPERNQELDKLVQKLDANEYFTFYGYVSGNKQIDDLMKQGKTDAVISLSEAYRKGNRIELILDSSDPNTATIEANYIKSVIAEFSGVKIPVNISVQYLFNPQMRSAYNFVPGIMGLILMLVCAMMTSISIVREKEMGTMEVLLVSPTKPLLIILAKMVPYFLLSVINLITILLLSFFVLDIPVTGSLIWLFVLSAEYIMLALSFGLLISSVMNTQVTAMLSSVMILMFPTILLSGMMYPVENLPMPLQILSNIVPARWYIAGVRKLMIQGVDLQYVLIEMSVILGMIILITSVSLKKFKKRLE